VNRDGERPRPADEQPLEMSVPAEAEEEPYEVLGQSQLSSDQAHIMPQLFGWMTPDDQRERARYLTDVTRPQAARVETQPGAPGGSVGGIFTGEWTEEQENPATRS